MFIRSERLFLRPCWPEDRSEISALAECDAKLAAAWQMAREPEDRRCPRFLVTLPEGQECRIVGFVGLGRMADLVEAGLWIAPGFRGRGFGGEAVRALLGLARTLGLTRIAARPAAIADEAARRLLDGLGFEPAGDLFVRELADCNGHDQPCMAA